MIRLRLRWLLLVLALGTVAAAWRVSWLADHRSAESLLASAHALLARDVPDDDAALRRLNLALPLAIGEGSTELAGTILRERAALSMKRQAFSLALEDCVALLESYAPGDPDVLRMAANAAHLEGDLPRAEELAEELVQARSADPSAHNLLALLHYESAEAALDEVYDRLDEDRPSESASAGRDLAWRAAVLPQDDPHGRSAADALDRMARDEAQAAELRDATSTAAAHIVAARESWMRSLGRRRTGDAIEGLQTILTRAGLLEDVVSLGIIALHAPDFPGAGGVLVATALAAHDAGRDEEARKLVLATTAAVPGIVVPGTLEPAVLLRWTLLTHDLSLWVELESAADTLRTRPGLIRADRRLAAALPYLQGIARLEQNHVQAALPFLNRAGRYSGREELFPGEQTLAWSARARVDRRLALRAEERTAVMETTNVKAVPPPDDSAAARAYGEAWERRASFAAAQDDLDRAVDALAMAASYLPRRRDELEAHWNRLGQRALEQGGRSLDELQELYGFGPASASTATLPSWITVQLARRFLDAGQPPQATRILQDDVRNFPAFGPILRVAADAFAAQHAWKDAIDAWLEIGERFGYDDGLASALDSVPPESFPAEERLRWAKLDPRRALLAGMVDDLVARGEVNLALRSLRHSVEGTMPSAEVSLRARLQMDRHDWRAAFDTLSGIDPADPAFASIAGALVRSALELDDPGKPDSPLADAMARVRAAPHLEPDGFDAAVDALFARGLFATATELLDLLDSETGARSPAIVLRRAVAEVATGDSEDAPATLERAAAFFPAEAGVGQLLAALDGDDPKALRDAALALFLGPLHGDPFREGLARALYGDVERALPLLVQADADRHGLDFLRHLGLLTVTALSTRDDAPGASLPDSSTSTVVPGELAAWREELARIDPVVTPEHVLGLLLALDVPPWGGWASVRLFQLVPVLSGSAWARLLTATSEHVLGRDAEARRLTGALTPPAMRMPWAWVLLEQLEQSAVSPDDPASSRALVRARVGRVLAFGARGLDPAELPFLVSDTLHLLHHPRLAERVLKAALTEARASNADTGPLLLAFARIATEAGDVASALAAYDERVAQLDREAETTGTTPDELRTLLPEVLALLPDAHAAGILSATAWFARLEAWAARLPDDPSLPRALGERVIDGPTSRLASSVARALGYLDRFRQSMHGAHIEDLRPEEASRWTALYARLAPDRAVSFAHDELLAHPFSLPLWRNWADALRTAHRYDDALDVFRILSAVVPDTHSIGSLARVLIDSRSSPRLALAAIARARSVEPHAKSDPELDLLEGIALSSERDPARTRGITLLQKLHDRVRKGTAHLEIERVAKPLIEALLARGSREDAQQAARIAGQVGKGTRGGLEGTWFAVVRILSQP